ncbi:MAG: aquaporin Z [Fimbriiglobus sp.]|jgi:aquaporin Z|nr:aquaporin Z [Fimbriiglobus sp.]
MPVALWKKLLAEFIGTGWLVFGGCGSAVLAAVFLKTEGSTPINLGIALVGVSLAFGLTVLTMAFAIGHVSGCHLNPAVTVGLAVAGRVGWKDVAPYIVAQVVGATAAAGVLAVIVWGKEGSGSLGDFAANGFGDHSPGKFSLTAAFLTEAVLTAMFLLVILGSTDRKAPAGFAPIAIGLCLTLIHLVSIPVTNTSVNPARSTSQAIFAFESGWAMNQLWLFWAAPIVGAVLGGLIHKMVFASDAGETK